MRNLTFKGTFLLLALIVSQITAWSAETIPADIHFTELKMKAGGRVWVYLPAAAKDKSLACVIVPPAGSRLFHGMLLGEGDRAEHFPYVRAGFAVISFDISGPWPEDDHVTNARAAEAIQAFIDAQSGVKDAEEALLLAQEKYKQIDPTRIYVAGHSSAGTLALQIAAFNNRIKACAAYAPICNLEERWGPKNIGLVEKILPGSTAQLQKASPNQLKIQVPVFLFHAKDDSNVKPETVIAYKELLQRSGCKLEYAVAETGEHYDSMIKEGLPKGIKWLLEVDRASK